MAVAAASAPPPTGDERWDTLLAALAEHLAAGHDAAPPPWVELRVLQQEILPHLAGPEAGELTITVEVEATWPDGFPEDKIRILTENAATAGSA